jgi:hypothetical protein
MRIRRTFPVIVAVLVVAAAVTLAVQLRKHAPPEAARLLPGADAFVYFDLSWIRRANAEKELPAVSHDPEYERFIRETGFQFERDLDEAAFAVHYPASWPGGGTGGAAPEPRFSEVLVGKFQSERLTSYLRQIAQSIENYQSVDIFTIRIENRTLRVAVLSADSVAASNHDDPAVIRGMIDHSRRLASPFGGPALLRQYYKHVQLASLSWVVARIEPRASGTWGALFPAPATVVASGTYLDPLHLKLKSGAIRLRAQAFTGSADQARALVDKVNVFLVLSHSAEAAVGLHGTDPDVKAFFDSLQVKQEGDRAVLSASLPYTFLHKMLADSGSEMSPASTAPAASATPAKAR